MAEDLVIAPYATALALMIAPAEACENLQRLAADGREGAYGFYEAVDYTPARLPPDETSATIRSFMAHHQGMSLLALVNLLRDSPMQRRFMACPLLKAADLLLQERVPKAAASVFAEDLAAESTPAASGERRGRHAGLHRSALAGTGGPPAFQRPLPCRDQQRRRRLQPLARPGGHPLARGRHPRLLGNLRLPARPGDGRVLVRRAPARPARDAKDYEAIFTQARAEFRQAATGLETHTEISVSPEDDVELRRIRLTNHSSAARVIELTSYAEVVLAPQAADAAHPAFGNLFVQTEFVPQAVRHPLHPPRRSPEEKPPWLLHLMVVQGGRPGEISCETDRSRFIGRGGTLASPAALRAARPAVQHQRVRARSHHRRCGARSRWQPDETAVVDLIIGRGGKPGGGAGPGGEVPGLAA